MNELQLGQIGQIAVPVTDLVRAVGFYRDTLGLEFLFDAPGLAFFNCGGVRLMLGTEDIEEDVRAATLYFRVPDIDAAYAQLKGRGVEFVDAPHLIARMPDHELWMTFFRDPDGNVLALMCEKPLPAAAQARPSAERA